jgi:hypothetical protein
MTEAPTQHRVSVDAVSPVTFETEPRSSGPGSVRVHRPGLGQANATARSRAIPPRRRLLNHRDLLATDIVELRGTTADHELGSGLILGRMLGPRER